jgi:hypothetical protein
VREMESLRHLKRSPLGPNNNGAKKPLPNKLDSYIKNLESERDFYKHEIDTLQDLLKASGQHHHQQTLHNNSSINHKSRRDSADPSRKSKSISPSKTAQNLISSQTRCSVCAGKEANARSQSPLASTEEFRKLKRERDELKGLLDKFENHMEQV